MSLALINESAKEVRRLAIAGSPLAVGDFRLKKLIAPLEQAGTKVPVFGQVAKAIGDLVNGKEADSASNLLSLSTLLNAILYTQGQTGAEGDIGELETFGTSCTSTKTTARVLKPLVEALSSSGGERYKIVKAAVERGAFNDLRLIEPAIRALDDNYPEMADLVVEKILPTYGPGIAPLLKQKLNIKGKKSDARRLRILHQLDPAGTIDLCKTALEDGSPDVKVAAIACLGKHEEHIPLVSEQANSKNKVVRAAALEALAEHDRPEIVKMFSDLIQGKALELLIKPFGVIRNQQVVNSLLAEGKRVFDLIVKGDADQIPRYWEILNCLEERKDSVGEEFVLTCFAQSEKLAKLKAPKNSPLGGADLIDRLASLLYKTGSPKALDAVLAKRDILPLVTFPVALRSARRLWPSDKVYTEFSPLLDQKKGQGKDKAEQIERLVLESHWDQSSRFELMMADEPDSPDAEALRKAEWDARWLDAGIKADREAIVYCLARPGHKAAIEYLLKRLDAKNQSYTGLIIQGLARCQYAKLTDAFLNVVKKKTKSARYLDYDVQLLFESARYLPAADLPRLEEIAADMDEKFVDKYLEGLQPLRPAKQ